MMAGRRSEHRVVCRHQQPQVSTSVSQLQGVSSFLPTGQPQVAEVGHRSNSLHDQLLLPVDEAQLPRRRHQGVRPGREGCGEASVIERRHQPPEPFRLSCAITSPEPPARISRDTPAGQVRESGCPPTAGNWVSLEVCRHPRPASPTHRIGSAIVPSPVSDRPHRSSSDKSERAKEPWPDPPLRSPHEFRGGLCTSPEARRGP